MAHVVGTDHDDDDFRSQSDELAMGEAPEDMLRAVTAESEIGRFERSKILFPSGLPFPALSDGIAQKGQIDLTRFGGGHTLGVTFDPPRFPIARDRGGRNVGRRLRHQGCHEEQTGGEKER